MRHGLVKVTCDNATMMTNQCRVFQQKESYLGFINRSRIAGTTNSWMEHSFPNARVTRKLLRDSHRIALKFFGQVAP